MRMDEYFEYPATMRFEPATPNEVIEAAISGLNEAGYETDWVVRTKVKIQPEESEDRDSDA